MYPTDPASVRQLRSAELLAADQYRLCHQSDSSSEQVRPRFVSMILRRLSKGPAVDESLELDGSLELFVGLDRQDLARLARHFSFVEVNDGASLARQGDPASEFVVVLTGRIGVSLDGMPLAVFDPGAQFGAVPLIDGSPGRFSRASFDVLEPSMIAIADRNQFFEILKNFPVVGQRILQIAEVRRAYLRGHADARALAADRESAPFPVHLLERI
jgi:CRP-like cAMP-binding protein